MTFSLVWENELWTIDSSDKDQTFQPFTANRWNSLSIRCARTTFIKRSAENKNEIKLDVLPGSNLWQELISNDSFNRILPTIKKNASRLCKMKYLLMLDKYRCYIRVWLINKKPKSLLSEQFRWASWVCLLVKYTCLYALDLPIIFFDDYPWKSED